MTMEEIHLVEDCQVMIGKAEKLLAKAIRILRTTDLFPIQASDLKAYLAAIESTDMRITERCVEMQADEVEDEKAVDDV